MDALILYAIESKNNFKIRINIQNITAEKINTWLKKSQYLSDKISINESIDIVIRNQQKDYVKTLVFENGIQQKEKNYCCLKKGIKSITFTEFDGQLTGKVVCYMKKNIPYTDKITAEASNKIVIKLDICIPMTDTVSLHIILIKNIHQENKSHINYLKYIVQKMFPKDLTYKTIIQSQSWNICDNILLEIKFREIKFGSSELHDSIDKEIFDIDSFSDPPVFPSKTGKVTKIERTQSKSSKTSNIKHIQFEIKTVINELTEYFCVKDEQLSHQYLITEIAKYISPKLVKNFASGKWGLKQLLFTPRPMRKVYM